MRLLRAVTWLTCISAARAHSCHHHAAAADELMDPALNQTDIAVANGTDAMMIRQAKPHWRVRIFASTGQTLGASKLMFQRTARAIMDKILDIAASARGTTETFAEWAYNVHGQDNIFTCDTTIEMEGDHPWCSLIKYSGSLEDEIAHHLESAGHQDVTLQLEALGAHGHYQEVAFINWEVVE